MNAAISLKADALASGRHLLFVIERGGATFTGGRNEDFEEVVAIAQCEESPAELAHRVLQRIALAERSHRYFDAVVLSTGSTATEEVSSARLLIALGIAAHARVSPNLSELLLVASADTEPAAREQLLNLSHELVLGADGAPLSVRLCFAKRRSVSSSGKSLSRLRHAKTQRAAAALRGGRATRRRPA
jgi:hypothetical protein